MYTKSMLSFIIFDIFNDIFTASTTTTSVNSFGYLCSLLPRPLDTMNLWICMWIRMVLSVRTQKKISYLILAWIFLSMCSGWNW